MVRRENVVEVQGHAGGRGTVIIHHIVSKEEMLGHGRLYARIVLPPQTSVGWHQHVHDVEPYYVLKGEGDFIEGDVNGENRTTTKIHPGDVCTIEAGQWHSLENNSSEDLEVMALIYNEVGYSNL